MLRRTELRSSTAPPAMPSCSVGSGSNAMSLRPALSALDPQAITELTALYREARFSDHLLDESDRRAALDALERLHHALGGSTVGAAT